MNAEHVTYAGTRVVATVPLSFEELTAAFERQVPRFDVETLLELQSRGADWSEVEATIIGGVGPLGFVLFARFDHGALATVGGTPTRAVLYMVGNPLIARSMVVRDPAAGLYAPLRVEIFVDATGATRVAYELPSSVLGPLGDAGISEVAGMLDERLAAALEAVVRVAATA